MRPVLHGDIVAGARVLLAVNEADRAALIGHMLDEAGWADAHRKRTGRAHPVWGDGSLMAAALRRRPPREPLLTETDYCTCLIQVLEAVVARRLDPRRDLPDDPGRIGSPTPERRDRVGFKDT